MLRDKQIARNCWPMARITATFPGRDRHVRKVELKTSDQGDVKTYLRQSQRSFYFYLKTDLETEVLYHVDSDLTNVRRGVCCP